MTDRQIPTPGRIVMYTLSSVDANNIMRKGGYSKAGSVFPAIVIQPHPYGDGSSDEFDVDLAVQLPDGIAYCATQVREGTTSHHSWRWPVLVGHNNKEEQQ